MEPLGPVIVREVGERVKVTSAGYLMGSRPMCDCARGVEEKGRERVLNAARVDDDDRGRSMTALVLVRL